MYRTDNFLNSYYETISTESGDIVSLADVKLFLKVGHAAEDTLIQSLITSAISNLEGYTNTVLRQTVYSGFYTNAMCTNRERFRFVPLERAPFQSIQTLSEYEADGTLTVIDTDDYEIRRRKQFSRILFTTATTTFTNYFLSDDQPWQYKADFTAGYGIANIPELIKIAIMRYVNYLYRNRGDCLASCGNDTVRDIYRPLSQAGLVIRSVF